MLDASHLLTLAMDRLTGGAIVLDAGLHVVAATQSAAALMGGEIRVGMHAVKLLSEHEGDHALAEALGAGRPTTLVLPRFNTAGERRFVRVRATPLESRRHCVGFIVTLVDEPATGDAPECFHGMWTRDHGMKRLFRLVERIAPSDLAVTIEGEMGTGKASLASAIHDLSHRRGGPFRGISCAAVTRDVLERHIADGGTLFLDGVDELPHELQSELLRVLENVVSPADAALTAANVRLIASTHTPLHDAVERGHFRADLAIRLRVVSLHLPPLRMRRGDAALLVDRMVAELNARGGRTVERIQPAARSRLEHYGWPGNVRELRAALESAFALGEGPVLSASDLPPEIAAPLVPRDGPVVGDLAAAPPPHHHGPGADEALVVKRALDRAHGDRERAASMLGMSRTTLWRRMRKLGLPS